MKTGSIPEETSVHYPDADLRIPGESIVLDDQEEDEAQDDEDNDDFDPTGTMSTTTTSSAGGASNTKRLSLKTKKHRKSSMKGSVGGNGGPPSASKRRRRRSSARFLRLSPDEEADDDESDNGGVGKSGLTVDNLGEVYRKAIRMNAENRINAANSWDLNLIDHLDRFTAPELRSTTMVSTMDETLTSATGVNFTKASCTLDASVKIYSYRVDDVHLTSYRVLANLNRTDNKDNKKTKNNETTDNIINEDSGTKSQRSASKNGAIVGDTLEHNLGRCMAS